MLSTTRLRTGTPILVANPRRYAGHGNIPVSDALERLAWLAGIEPGYHDLVGNWHHTSTEAKLALLAAMRVDIEASEAEIARLEALPGDEAGTQRCLMPGEIGIGRGWGVTCQAYGLRSSRNAGVGDLEDVALLAERLAAQGADFLGLSPLHALFPEAPERCSPYSPSSRRWFNELYIAVDVAAGELGLAAVEPGGAERLRAAAEIDWPAVAKHKTAALERLWGHFRQLHLRQAAETTFGRDFRRWRQTGGRELERFCRFQALAATAAQEAGRPVPFFDWPAGWRSPDDAAVHRFAQERAESVEQRAFLQWLIDRQLAAAQRRARAAGMRIGLYADLAVGVVPDGADAWADQASMVAGASVGAPPDPLGPLGQNWNVVAAAPAALLGTDAGPLRATLRAVMRHAGAVRIDHALGLMRLFLIPPGGTAADGTYVRYPFGRLLTAVAEESRRAGCVVVGEDLGTVPDGFRPRMLDAGLLGYRVVWFEREWPDPRFRPPEHYPDQALATISTHDLPTVRGFFAAQDIAWRHRLGHIPGPDALRVEHETRARDVWLLSEQLGWQGLPADPADPAQRAVSLHRYLARTSSWLAAMQLEDLADELEQANLPGTIDEHPNWRRRLSRAYDEVLASDHAARIMAAMREERPH
jgi:4-alpha-glucanotransferase